MHHRRTDIATLPGVHFESGAIIAKRRPRRDPLVTGLGPDHASFVRGVNLMRIRNGRIIEALGCVKAS